MVLASSLFETISRFRLYIIKHVSSVVLF